MPQIKGHYDIILNPSYFMSNVLQNKYDQKPSQSFSLLESEAKNPVSTKEDTDLDYIGLSCLILDDYFEDYA
ncbi:MAG TPA: hypothetical protein VMW55_06575 [Nitrosopumilaceae archaeon]|jgi:hypothetical protein|nr:hypothetical protein [Nitrosopumilaceae archaeon]